MARIRNSYDTGVFGRLAKWAKGEYRPFELDHEVDAESERGFELREAEHPEKREGNMRRFERVYQALAVLCCLTLIGALLVTVSYLPRFGEPGNPDNNEVSYRYIEKGLEETGATNIVAGMILDYRAFDTFGESCVLFTAVCCVFILLRNAGLEDDYYALAGDPILQAIAGVVSPLIILFGVYIMLNGHLSAGGGFAGGSVAGAGLILCLLGFGAERTRRVFTEKTFRAMTTGALTFYCLAKSYSFYTGANGLESGIPLGTPGAILSSGLILPLNLCVGMVVACTMYAFYVTFRKGGF